MRGYDIVYDDDEFQGGERECSGGRTGNIDYAFVDVEEGIREIGREGLPPRMVEFLGACAPRKLYCRGDVSLLGGKTVMVCGARDASPEGCDLAYRCGRLLADSGVIVASGYARGVDLAAHRGAFEAGGKTVALLPYGLARFRVHRDLGDAFDPACFLAVSELPPWGVFTARAALRRNKLLAALADAVIVVEPGETGGTWYSAEKASVMGKPLFFLEGARPEIIPRMETLGGRRIAVRNGAPEMGVVTGGEMKEAQ